MCVDRLVSEDFLKGEDLDWTKGPEVLGVKILDVTKDTVDVCTVLNPLVLGILDILKSEGLYCLEDVLLASLCQSELPVCKITVDYTGTGCTGCAHA